MRQLHDLHAPPLFRFLLRITFGDRQGAEDLLQETLLRAWRKLDQLNADVRTLRPWLFTVARRVAIDAGRARHTRPVESTGVDLSSVPAAEDPIERLIAAQTVARAMVRLSPLHQRVIYQIFFEGCTAAEAAARLGIPEGTVKSRTHHALRALRAAMRVEA
jgi:RNA polymerase sigma-70 factor (ECF subfamily)